MRQRPIPLPGSIAWAAGRISGRSLIYLGEHASRADLARLAPGLPPYPITKSTRLSVPVNFPRFALSRYSVAAFNALYFWQGARRAGGEFLVPWDRYFFPLDGIENWNRIYGRRGFLQHQCVLPETGARRVLGEILERVAASGAGSFLAVLKKLSAGTGLLSFPWPDIRLRWISAFRKEFLRSLTKLIAWSSMPAAVSIWRRMRVSHRQHSKVATHHWAGFAKSERRSAPIGRFNHFSRKGF